MVAKLSLMQCANPLLFSKETYEEYPLEYQDLKGYLRANDDGENTPFRNVKPFTHINYLDMLLYTNDGDIDLNRKLLCEYALFQVEKSKSLNKLPRLNNFYQFSSLNQLEPFTTNWYQSMLVLLESINATSIESFVLKDPHPLKMLEHMSGRDLQMLSPPDLTVSGALQDLTSYVVTRSIQKDIELKPQHMDEQVEFLKIAFNTILDHVASPRDTVHYEAKGDENLEIAVKDLQLVNNFLTKQFENDHVSYVQDIEKLQKNNKELQQKVLDYHAELVKSGEKLKEKEKRLLEMKESKPDNPLASLDYTSPVITSDMWFPSSPASVTSFNSSTSTTSQSITAMRTEFKKMLLETQRKHERELQSERDCRVQLERELQELRRSKGY